MFFCSVCTKSLKERMSCIFIKAEHNAVTNPKIFMWPTYNSNRDLKPLFSVIDCGFCGFTAAPYSKCIYNKWTKHFCQREKKHVIIVNKMFLSCTFNMIHAGTHIFFPSTLFILWHTYYLIHWGLFLCWSVIILSVIELHWATDDICDITGRRAIIQILLDFTAA